MTEYTEVALERFKRCAISYLADDFAIPAKIRLSLEECAATIRQDIFGKQLEKVDVKYPADWWQAVKDRWFPEWAKRRWPVQYKRHFIDAKALYPTIPDVPGHQHYLNITHHSYTGGYADMA